MEVPENEKAAFLKALGQHIELLITQKYKNKDQFLRETGFYPAALHEILTGKRDARVSTIQRLARVLGVKVRALFPDDPT